MNLFSRSKYMLAFGVVALTATVVKAQVLPALPLIPPAAVPGKEYSDNRDVDQFQNPDDLQNLFWDGLGNNLDAFDYSTSGPPPLDPDQVDALANEQDYLFNDLLGNKVSMIVSLSQENFLRNHNTNGSVGIWATANQVRNNPGTPAEVDAVELWGDPNSPQHDGSGGFDANHYSYIGDAIVPNPPGNVPAISIFYYDPNTDTSKSYIDHDPLRNQLNIDLDLNLDSIDVDALMVYDIEGDTFWGGGDTIIFSLRPTGLLDGGEIFVWQNGLPITYLQHGGRVWDTANQVALLFNSNSENIDALEAVPAVPEPGCLALALLGLGFFYAWRRRVA